MSRFTKPGIVIPIFFNMILLMGIPYFLRFSSNMSIRPLILAAFAFPWLLSFIVSSIIQHSDKSSKRRRQEKEQSDFV